MKKCLARVLISVMLLSGLSVTVFADTPQFLFTSVETEIGVLEMAPGTEDEVSFVVGNIDVERAITIQMETKAKELQEGEIALPPEWISFLPADSIELGPDTQTDVKVVVSVPADAQFGTYRIGVRARLGDYDGAPDFISGVSLSPAIGDKIVVNVSRGGAVKSEVVGGGAGLVGGGTDKVKSKGKSVLGDMDRENIFDVILLLLLLLIMVKVYSLEKKGDKNKKK